MRYHEIQIQQHQAARLLNRDYSLTRENILGDGLKLCRRAKAFNTSDHTTAYIRVVDEDGFGAPVFRLAPEPVAAFEQQNFLAGRGKMPSERAAARAAADDDDVVLLGHGDYSPSLAGRG